MGLTRRAFLRTAAVAAASLVGPWTLAGRTGSAATRDTPPLLFLTPSEYRAITRMAREIVPDEPVLCGLVDVARNIDGFLADNPSPDFLVMLRFLRLTRLLEPLLPILKRVSPPVAEDITSLRRVICFTGYYSDANGETDMPAEQRLVWPRIGFDGPRPDDWVPPDAEPQINSRSLADRILEET